MLFSPPEFANCTMDNKKFQSPKTGLCYFHRIYKRYIRQALEKFQSPKTGLCYFHCFGKTQETRTPQESFNPLKRVYAIFTLSLLIAKNKKQYYCFYFPFNNQISPLLIYRLFENKMFGDNLQYFTKKYHHFHCKNTPIVPPHPGDSLPGFSRFPRVSPNPQNTPWQQHPKFPLNNMK